MPLNFRSSTSLFQITSKAPAATLFHIEQKTGPGSIDEMSEFQLDVNDFNDIAGATNKTGRPSYIIHVQATYDYLMPTRRTIIKGMWWTDIFTLKENEKRISNRRDEDKRAIYYKPAAFKPIETFAEELALKGYEKLAARLQKKRIKLIP